jgi:hypothetical protein
MLANALAATNPYADLWSHLKSMHHAVTRAIELPSRQLVDLDRERLADLADFLRGSFTPVEVEEESLSESLLRSTADEASYTPVADIRDTVKSIRTFQEWRESSRIGFERKLQLLVNALDSFRVDMDTDLFAARVPGEEFRVVRDILEHLLRDTQSALLARR